MTTSVSSDHDDRAGGGTPRPPAAGVSPDAVGPELADRVEAAVLSVPGIVALHGGAFGEVGTYLPGRRVAGIALRDNETEVHVVVAYGAAVLETAKAVQAAVGALVGTPVNVAVEDVVPAREVTEPASGATDPNAGTKPEPRDATKAEPNAETNVETNAEPKERS